MKKHFLKFFAGAAVIGVTGLTTSCSSDDTTTDDVDPLPETERFFTVAGAIMDETPGNGNGGTVIYSVSEENVEDPNYEIDVFNDGFQVRSQRTARLQSSVDGSTMFNIAYGGDIGGQFSKYMANGGDDFEQVGGVVNISQYAGESPRWVKLFDGDKTGAAVSVSSPIVYTKTVGEGDDAEEVYDYTRGTATIVTLDME